jgi:hypothetical protein
LNQPKKDFTAKSAGAAKENLIFHDVPKIPERFQRLSALSAAQ